MPPLTKEEREYSLKFTCTDSQLPQNIQPDFYKVCNPLIAACNKKVIFTDCRVYGNIKKFLTCIKSIIDEIKGNMLKQPFILIETLTRLTEPMSNLLDIKENEEDNKNIDGAQLIQNIINYTGNIVRVFKISIMNSCANTLKTFDEKYTQQKAEKEKLISNLNSSVKNIDTASAPTIQELINNLEKEIDEPKTKFLKTKNLLENSIQEKLEDKNYFGKMFANIVFSN